VLLNRYLVAFGLTVAVEVPLYTLVLRWLWRVPVRRAAWLALAVNAVTHPLLWWALVPWTARPWYQVLVFAGEALVCLVEWLLLRRWLPLRAALLPMVAVGVNATSVAVGLAAALLSGAATGQPAG
jgi:hypothetical protein